MRTILTLLAGAMLATSAQAATSRHAAETGEAKLATALAGRVAGTPVNCISLREIESSEIIDGTGILYRTIGNRLYLNRPKSGQESLRDDDVLVTKTSLSQLCSIDTVQLIDRYSHIYQGFVSLGQFVPYTKVAAAR